MSSLFLEDQAYRRIWIADIILRITNIQDNRSTLTTFLTAQVAQWSDIAGDFEASWGKINTPNSRRSLDERGFFDDLGKLGKSVIDGVVDGANSIGSVFSKIGDVDLSKTVAFDVGIGEPGVRTNIITNSAWVYSSFYSFSRPASR